MQCLWDTTYSVLSTIHHIFFMHEKELCVTEWPWRCGLRQWSRVVANLHMLDSAPERLAAALTTIQFSHHVHGFSSHIEKFRAKFLSFLTLNFKVSNRFPSSSMLGLFTVQNLKCYLSQIGKCFHEKIIIFGWFDKWNKSKKTEVAVIENQICCCLHVQ